MIELGKCKEVTAVLKLKTSISPKGLIQYFTLGKTNINFFMLLKMPLTICLGIFFMLLLFPKNCERYLIMTVSGSGFENPRFPEIKKIYQNSK